MPLFGSGSSELGVVPTMRLSMVVREMPSLPFD